MKIFTKLHPVRTQLLLLTACLFSLTAFSQKRADRKMLEALEQHTARLSADPTRDSGSFTMLKKTAYLENQFRSAGISPVNNTYRQMVIYDEGKKFIPGTSLSLNNKLLQPGKDFIPLPYSAQAAVKGEPLIAVQERNQPWIMDINNYLTYGQDTDITTTLYKLAKQAVQDNASAVIFYNSTGNTQDISFNPNETISSLSIPVVYINHAAAKDYFSDPTASVAVKLSVAFSEKKDTGYNIIGSINNNAAKTILIGAYDAGDQAVLIELGRLLKSDKHFSKENYLLATFAGERNGISGDKYFLGNLPIDLSRLQCFISLHHTGSNKADPVLLVKGNLTSEWKDMLNKMKRKNRAVQEDTASNYYQRITVPVLTFAEHDSGRTTAEGELTVLKYLADMIREINRVEK